MVYKAVISFLCVPATPAVIGHEAAVIQNIIND